MNPLGGAVIAIRLVTLAGMGDWRLVRQKP